MNISDFIDGTRRRLAEIYRRIAAREGVVERGPGKGLRIDARSCPERFAAGDYELPVQEAMASLVRRGDVCYDIGANLGFFSVLLGRLVGPRGTVYAFEPVPHNAAVIERNARLNGLENLRVLRLALCRNDGTAELLLAHHQGGAVLKSAGTPPDPAGSLRVQTASVDKLVARQELKPPDFVKIDVEGAELDVLQGMQRVLQKWAPVVILEVDDETAAKCEEKTSSCLDLLHGMGYGTEPLANAYPDTRWFVRHYVARPATAGSHVA